MVQNQSMAQIQENLADVPEGRLLEIDAAEERKIWKRFPQGKGRRVCRTVFPGITLIFEEYLTERADYARDAAADALEICHCRSGYIGRSAEEGGAFYLGPGDFCVTPAARAAQDLAITLPGGYYEGMLLRIDCTQFDAALPELLHGTGVTGRLLFDKFCPRGGFTTVTGNEKNGSVFSGFYGHSTPLRESWLWVKTLELLLYLAEMSVTPEQEFGKYRAEQVEIARAVHDELLRHMDRRVTIEELSRKYLMNPTTLKSVFKAVYGDSLAAHMKAHRMEKAAALLCQTGDSISQIAQAVGYGSQSKFSAAFKELYQMLPLEYRRLHSGQ